MKRSLKLLLYGGLGVFLAVAVLLIRNPAESPSTRLLDAERASIVAGATSTSESVIDDSLSPGNNPLAGTSVVAGLRASGADEAGDASASSRELLSFATSRTTDALIDIADSSMDRDADEQPERSEQQELPSCWRVVTNQRGIANPDPHYLTNRDRDEVFSGESSVRFSSQDERAQYEHGMLMQFVNAAEFAGSPIEFAAYIKTEDVRSGVMMWLIATNAQGTIVAGQGFDWIVDAMDWHPRSIVEYLPDDTVALMFGFRILGQGTLWADEVRIAKVAADVPLTEPVSPRGAAALTPPNVAELLDSPQNLDFENWDASMTSYPDCAGSIESE